MFIKVVTNKLDHYCGVLFQRRTFSVFICTHSTLFHQSVKTGNTLTLYDMIPAEQQTLVSCNLSGLNLEKKIRTKQSPSSLYACLNFRSLQLKRSVLTVIYYVCEHLKCKTWKWTYPLFTVVDDFALIMAKVTEVYLIPVSSMCHQWEQFSSTWSSETWWWEHNSPAHLGGKANQIKSGLMQYTKMGNDCWWSSDMEWNQAGSMRL